MSKTREISSPPPYLAEQHFSERARASSHHRLTNFFKTSCTQAVLKHRAPPTHQYPIGTQCKVNARAHQKALLEVEEKIESLLLEKPLVQTHQYELAKTEHPNVYKVAKTRQGLKIKPFYCKVDKLRPLNPVICTYPKTVQKQAGRRKPNALAKAPTYDYYSQEVTKINKIHHLILKRDRQLTALIAKALPPLT